MKRDIEKLKLGVICHSYNSFQKDPIEIISSHLSSVDVFVRLNFIAEMGNIIRIPQIENYSSSHKIDLTGLPHNLHVNATPVWYFPLDCEYKKLGERHYSRVKSEIQKISGTFDLIHSHFTWSSGYVGARLKEEYGFPFVVTGHGYDVYSLPFKDGEWRNKIEYVLNSADHIITVSRSNLTCIKRLDVSTPITVIPNGFKSNLFYPRDLIECRKKLNLPLDKKIILTVGNLDPIKGHKHLINSIHNIVKDRDDILCVIVGAGYLRNSLKRQIRSLGLEKFIWLAGGKPHGEIPLWMNACDLFVLPSLRESFGVVQIEAMACGKPVVATRNGGSEEIVISDEYGLLAQPSDPDDLAEKILQALETEWDREKIILYAEGYRWEDVVKRILDLYLQIL